MPGAQCKGRDIAVGIAAFVGSMSRISPRAGALTEAFVATL